MKTVTIKNESLNHRPHTIKIGKEHAVFWSLTDEELNDLKEELDLYINSLKK